VAGRALGKATSPDGGPMGTGNGFLFGSMVPRGGRRAGIMQSTLKSAARRAANK